MRPIEEGQELSYKLLQGDRGDRRFLTVHRFFSKTTDKSLIAGKSLSSNSSYDVFVCEGDCLPEKKGRLNLTAYLCVSFDTVLGSLFTNLNSSYDTRLQSTWRPLFQC